MKKTASKPTTAATRRPAESAAPAAAKKTAGDSGMRAVAAKPASSKPAGPKLSPAKTHLAQRVELEAFLGKLGAKDRQNLEKHVAALEAEPDGNHLRLWKRLAVALATLSPHAAQTNGQQSIQFYIPDGADGRYRKQVFALEDLRDGKLTVYAVDALEKAIAGGFLAAPRKQEEEVEGPLAYPVGDGLALSIETLDSNNTPDPPAFYKHMLGWNRKALRITIPNDSPITLVAAAEELFATAADAWMKRSE